MFVVYRGDSRRPDDTRPYRVPGMDPLPLGEARAFTDDDVQNHFKWESATDFCEFLFGDLGVYNRNMPTPRFTIHAEKPEDVPLEGETPSAVPGGTDTTDEPTPKPGRGRRPQSPSSTADAPSKE